MHFRLVFVLSFIVGFFQYAGIPYQLLVAYFSIVSNNFYWMRRKRLKENHLRRTKKESFFFPGKAQGFNDNFFLSFILMSYHYRNA
jgi:hypothetical protein